MKKYVLFRFVPTMGCNYRCSYCFIPNDHKARPETMFGNHPAQVWVEAMALWSDYDVEFYMWGGEPFSTNGTYELVKGWTKYAHVVCCSRIDTNMAYVDKILELCPTPKVKLNCSWHREYESLESFYGKVRRLQQENMVGMANFVANDSNLKYLKETCGKNLDNLIAMFDDIGVFMNVAADFSIFESGNFLKKRKYRNLLSKYTCPEDWKQLRCEKGACDCSASQHFFTVHQNGDITPCLSNDVVGNFFNGTLDTKQKVFCAERCPSLIAYPFRLDNDLPIRSSLMEYVERNRRHRREMNV